MSSLLVQILWLIIGPSDYLGGGDGPLFAFAASGYCSGVATPCSSVFWGTTCIDSSTISSSCPLSLDACKVTCEREGATDYNSPCRCRVSPLGCTGGFFSSCESSITCNGLANCDALNDRLDCTLTGGCKWNYNYNPSPTSASVADEGSSTSSLIVINETNSSTTALVASAQITPVLNSTLQYPAPVSQSLITGNASSTPLPSPPATSTLNNVTIDDEDGEEDSTVGNVIFDDEVGEKDVGVSDVVNDGSIVSVGNEGMLGDLDGGDDRGDNVAGSNYDNETKEVVGGSTLIVDDEGGAKHSDVSNAGVEDGADYSNAAIEDVGSLDSNSSDAAHFSRSQWRQTWRWLFPLFIWKF